MQLEAQLGATQAASQREAVLLSSLNSTVVLVDEALQNFSEAYRLEKRAQFDNNMAYFGGDGFIERMEQMDRDMSMNQAVPIALAGSQALQRAYQAIPPVVMTEHPDLVALSRCPMPWLRQSNMLGNMMMDDFGGGFGALYGDMRAGNKLRGNLMALEQTLGIVQQNRAILAGVRSRLQGKAQGYAQQSAQIKAQIDAIQNATFNSVLHSSGVFTTAQQPSGFSGGFAPPPQATVAAQVVATAPPAPAMAQAQAVPDLMNMSVPPPAMGATAL